MLASIAARWRAGLDPARSDRSSHEAAHAALEVLRPFLAVRDALLALEDPDHRLLARLYDAMQDPKLDPAPELLRILRAIAALR